MKFYQLILIPIFLMLSLQSQAVVAQDFSQLPEAAAQHQGHQKSAMQSHDCCDKEHPSATTGCDFCGEACQCQSGCHFSTVSMALMNGHLLLQSPLNATPFPLFISSLQTTDLAHEKRPPRLG